MRDSFIACSAGRYLVLGFGLVILGCAAHPGCRSQPNQAPTVEFPATDGQATRVRVEVVSNAREREKGLMYRRHLDADAGMLFVYPVEDNHTFWMKNTHLSLDLVFIGANLRVVGILERAKPMSVERLQVDCASRFILEVNAGFCQQHGIREGMRVLLHGVNYDP